MMKKIKVSVIIPIYNMEKYLRECLNSVVNQTLDGVEVICINNGCTDSSEQIIAEFLENSGSVKLVKIDLEKNIRPAGAINLGLENANGKYVCVLDADDYYKNENVLKTVVDKVEKYDVDGALFEAETFFESDRIRDEYLRIGGRYRQSEDLKEEVYDGVHVYEKMIEEVDFAPTVWRQIWRSDFLKKNGLKCSERTKGWYDYLFTFCVMLSARRVLYIPESMYMYRMREGAYSSHTYDMERLLAHFYCYRDGMQYIEDVDCNDICLDKSVMFFAKTLINTIKTNAIKLIKEGVDFAFELKDKPIDWIHLNLLLTEGHGYIDRLFTPKEYNALNRATDIVIYGAGAAGQDLARLLEQFGLKDYKFAVTRKRETDSQDILEIGDVSAQSNDVVIVLAATKKYRKEMMNTLNNLGIKDCICLSNSI